MQKILFINSNLEIGGASLLLKNIIEKLDKKEFDCHIWAPYEGKLKEEYEKLQIPVHIQDFEIDKVNREQSFLKFDNETKNKLQDILNRHQKNKKSLAIRCAGNITGKILEEFDFSEINFVGIFDNNPALIGKKIKEYKIYPFSEFNNFAVDTVLIAHNQPAFLKKEIKCKKIKVIDNLFIDTGFSKAKKVIKYFCDLSKPIDLIRKINPDTVFINNARNFWAAIAGKLLNKKVIWAIHEGYDPKTFRVFPHFLYLLSFKCADRLIFPSYATYEFYKQLIPENKATIIHNGLDIDKIQEFKAKNPPELTRRELNIPNNHKIVCTVGVVEEVKGHIYFVKSAINLLKESAGKDYTFIIVGKKDNEYSALIEKTIEESGFKNNFRLIPVVDNAYKYFNIADIYITSSFSETFCLANLEAMAFEKPVISTNVCGIPEVITHGKTGILIPPENMEENIINSIKSLLENPDLAKKLSQNAFNEVCEKFTFDSTLDKYIEIIKQ